MKWLYKLFNAVTPEERRGIYLENPKWEVSPIRDMSAFLRALNYILPEDHVIHLEGGTPDEEIRSFLESRKAVNTIKIEMGIIWPRPLCYHIPFTHSNINELAEIMERHATPEVAAHFHIYKDNKIILQWYDAFYNEPMYFSEDIAEEKIKQFCEKLSLKYRLIKEI